MNKDRTKRKREEESSGPNKQQKTKASPKKRAIVVCVKRSKGVIVQNCDVYIGRAYNRGGWKLAQSIWANPFTIKKCGSAQEAIKKYEEYIRSKSELLDKLPELSGKILGCWCKKKGNEPCHGDILLKLLKEKEIDSL